MATHENQVSLHRRVDELQITTNRLKNEQLRFQEARHECQAAVSQLLKKNDASTLAYQEASSQVASIKEQVSQLVQEKQRLDSELQVQIQGRLADQLKHTQVEVNLDRVADTFDTLRKKSELLQARQKSMKCRVCTERPVEFALLPCFHFCYCQPCVETLSECTVCHEIKQGVQKIYYG